MRNKNSVSEIKNCKSCHGEISIKAKKCQHCSEDLRPWVKRHPILTTVGIILVLGTFAGASEPSNSVTKESDKKTEQDSENKKILNKKNAKLQVHNWNWKEEYGYIKVEGEVQNISKKNIKNGMILAKFYDEEGNFIKSSDAMLQYQPILSEQISPFTAMTTSNPAIKKVTIEFKTMFGGALSHNTREE